MLLRSPVAGAKARDHLKLGQSLFSGGEFASARKFFKTAIKENPRSAEARFYLALTCEAMGQLSDAAAKYTETLRLDRAHAHAAQRLSWLLHAGRLPRGVALDPHGLIAALDHNTADRDLLANVAFDQVMQTGPIKEFLNLGETKGWGAAAHRALKGDELDRASTVLLRAALSAGIVAQPRLENLLVAIRREFVLMLGAPLRIARPPGEFAAALAAQCLLNEHVWPEAADEARIIEGFAPDCELLRTGDPAQTFRALAYAMYRSPDSLPHAAAVANALRDAPPGPARQTLLAWFDERKDIAERAAAMPSLIRADDATSLAVAGQYDAAPYPRWTSVLTYGEGTFIERMAEVFPRRELAFAEKPFEVLVAGCGTGRQAVSAAIDFGPKAQVTGIDITRTSLGYAQRMTERFGVPNLSLVRADIETLPDDAPHFRNRFDIIECVGVLHHMERPLSGWRALKSCLAPGGIMMIGLYSRTARTGLSALRARDDYPGPGCDDAALRRFRETVRTLPTGTPGTEFRRSADFYAASGFRDLLLHVHEHTFSLEEIDAFLDAEDLVFRGFFDVPSDVLRRRFPTETGAGSLARWAALEREQPNLFGSMYQFWCTPKAR